MEKEKNDVALTLNVAFPAPTSSGGSENSLGSTEAFSLSIPPPPLVDLQSIGALPKTSLGDLSTHSPYGEEPADGSFHLSIPKPVAPEITSLATMCIVLDIVYPPSAPSSAPYAGDAKENLPKTNVSHSLKDQDCCRNANTTEKVQPSAPQTTHRPETEPRVRKLRLSKSRSSQRSKTLRLPRPGPLDDLTPTSPVYPGTKQNNSASPATSFQQQSPKTSCTSIIYSLVSPGRSTLAQQTAKSQVSSAQKAPPSSLWVPGQSSRALASSQKACPQGLQKTYNKSAPQTPTRNPNMCSFFTRDNIAHNANSRSQVCENSSQNIPTSENRSQSYVSNQASNAQINKNTQFNNGYQNHPFADIQCCAGADTNGIKTDQGSSSNDLEEYIPRQLDSPAQNNAPKTYGNSMPNVSVQANPTMNSQNAWTNRNANLSGPNNGGYGLGPSQKIQRCFSQVFVGVKHVWVGDECVPVKESDMSLDMYGEPHPRPKQQISTLPPNLLKRQQQLASPPQVVQKKQWRRSFHQSVDGRNSSVQIGEKG